MKKETSSVDDVVETSATLTEKERRIRQIKNSPPIFIIGSQRSGTSFLYRLVQSYLKIGFGRDNGNFVRMMEMLRFYGDLTEEVNIRRLLKDILAIPEFKKRFKGLEIDPDHFIANLEERSYAEVVRRFYAEWAYFKDTDRWGGKTPDYSIYANELYSLFPDAKFIHIIRDGRDVALSLFKLEWGPESPMQAAKHWKDRAKSALEFGKKLTGKTYMELRYEGLLDNPEKEFARIVHFIEYEGDREALIEQFNREIEGKIKQGNYNKWKREMSPRQIKAFERVSGDLLDELGYEITNSSETLANKPGPIAWTMDHAENLLRKLARGQGFLGLWNRIRRFFKDNFVKLSFYLGRR
ncbi:MAG: sulfotransferase family protein [Calditrichia bacterium]